MIDFKKDKNYIFSLLSEVLYDWRNTDWDDPNKYSIEKNIFSICKEVTELDLEQQTVYTDKDDMLSKL